MNKILCTLFIFTIFVNINISPMGKLMVKLQNITIEPYVCVLYSIIKGGNATCLNYQIYNTKAPIPTFFMSNPIPAFVTLAFIENTTNTLIKGFIRKSPLSQYNLNTCHEIIRLSVYDINNHLIIIRLIAITLSAHLRKILFQPVICVNCSEIIKNEEAAIMLKCMNAVHKQCYANHCLEKRCRICDQTPGEDFWVELEAIPHDTL